MSLLDNEFTGQTRAGLEQTSGGFEQTWPGLEQTRRGFEQTWAGLEPLEPREVHVELSRN
jgi:hypothetical protein